MANRGVDRGSFRRKGKKGTLYWRGTLPKRTDAGVIREPVERSCGTSEEADARKFRDALIKDAYDALTQPFEGASSLGMSFLEAIDNYERSGRGNGNERFLIQLAHEIGHVPIAEIDQDFVDRLAATLYPNALPSTRNRSIYTPISAVLCSISLKGYTAPRLKRPKGHLRPSNFKRPPEDWWAKVLPECSPNLRAYHLFCTLHGRRPGEARAITPADIDPVTWRVFVFDTKIGQKISFILNPKVIKALAAYPWKQSARVFGYMSHTGVNTATRKACVRAGVPYHCPKDTGRHSWATRFLEEGHTLKELQVAGRWKNIQTPAMIYGHLEHSKVDDAVRDVGEKWAEAQLCDMGNEKSESRANDGQTKRSAA
jgi:integrase